MYCGVRKYPSEHFLNQSVIVLPQISGLRIWCPSRKFGLKSLLYLVLLKGEVNFFVREFLEDFYFPSAFTVVIESFLRTSSSK